MLATDGSPSAETATRQAIELARSLETSLLITCVEHENVPLYGYYGYAEIVSELKRDQLRRIEEVTAVVSEQADAAGVEYEILLLSGIPGEEICKAAAERGVRMIVLGAHGWNRLGRLIHGSVSTYVLHHAAVPVLVVQGRDEAANIEGAAELISTQ